MLGGRGGYGSGLGGEAVAVIGRGRHYARSAYRSLAPYSVKLAKHL